MKESKEIIVINNDKHEFAVMPYLTYAQVQNIANSAIKHDTWAERQYIIDMMVLSYATDIGEADIDKYGHDYFLMNGIIDFVRDNVKNYEDIFKAIGMMEDMPHVLSKLSKEIIPTIEEKFKKYGITNNKRTTTKKRDTGKT